MNPVNEARIRSWICFSSNKSLIYGFDKRDEVRKSRLFTIQLPALWLDWLIALAASQTPDANTDIHVAHMWFLDLAPTIFNKEKATGRPYQPVSLSGFAQMIDPVHLSERAKPYEPLPPYPMTFLNPDRGSLFNGMFININGDTDRDYRRLSRSC